MYTIIDLSPQLSMYRAERKVSWKIHARFRHNPFQRASIRSRQACSSEGGIAATRMIQSGVNKQRCESEPTFRQGLGYETLHRSQQPIESRNIDVSEHKDGASCLEVYFICARDPVYLVHR
jgi:hypothetical protein